MEKERLKVAWEDHGECRSCGWHSAFYEVEDLLEEDEEESGRWSAPCLSEDAYESGDHRGCYIYPTEAEKEFEHPED